MQDGNYGERHVFRILPPSTWLFNKGKEPEEIKTANLVDYCSYLKDGSIDLSEILFDGVDIENRNETKFDIGESYFVVNGSRERAEELMKAVANNFNSYLKKNSKNGRHPKFNYQLVN